MKKVFSNVLIEKKIKNKLKTNSNKRLKKKLYNKLLYCKTFCYKNVYNILLYNRKQYVLYNIYKSDHENILCGVPQGSILDPLLLILYVNDITNASNVLEYVLFADDIAITIKLIKSRDRIMKLQKKVVRICQGAIT